MQAVIFCGGLGTRLFPITRFLPKSLIPVCGEPFIKHQIAILKKNNINKFVFLVGNKSSQLIKYIKKNFSDENYKIFKDKRFNQGTGKSLLDCIDHLQNEFFIMYGDSYLDCNLKKIKNYFKNKKYNSMMIICKNSNKRYTNNIKIYRKESKIIHYGSKKNLNYIDYGITFFKKDILINLKKNKIDEKMVSIFNLLSKANNLNYYLEKKHFEEIGSFEGLYNLKKSYEKKYF
tara:strand:+ start:1178 stop:1873 length:696 start_codon:yes stop_codon:yes gene_type:complete